MSWKNVSSFSARTKDRTPNAWKFNARGVILTVHRHIHYPPDVWLASAEPFFDMKELTAKDPEKAKKEAIELVVSYLQKSIDLFVQE